MCRKGKIKLQKQTNKQMAIKKEENKRKRGLCESVYELL